MLGAVNMPRTGRPWHEDAGWLRLGAVVSALLCVAGMIGAISTLVETGFGTSNASLSVTTWALLVAGIASGLIVSSLAARNRRRTAENRSRGLGSE